MDGKANGAVSQRIGEHVAQTCWANLPPATAHATRRALLDALGVSLAATGLAPEVEAFRQRVLADGGRRQSRLLAGGRRVPAEAAAFANAALGHAMDYGDTFDAGPAHPSAALAPALLALADADPGIDGGLFLAAMAAGSDLACRLSLAPARPYEDGGWYPPPMVGALGAAAAAARLLGLGADGIVQAIGLAMLGAAFPGEMKYDPLTRLRALREAFAARAATSAALLARDGVRGFVAPLEGKAGFFAIHGGGLNEGALLGDLGARFLGDEVSFKPWPCCRGTHAYIEAAMALRPLVAGRAIVTIETPIGPVQQMLSRPVARKARPESAIDAKFSIPFTTAHALVHGSVTLDSFGPGALSDPAVLALAARVQPVDAPGWGRAQAASGALTLLLADGTRLHRDVPQAAGHPGAPLADEELVAKFIACAARARRPMPANRAEGLARHILRLGPDHPACSILRAAA